MQPASQPEITDLLRAWGKGNAAALDRLTPVVYNEPRPYPASRWAALVLIAVCFTPACSRAPQPAAQKADASVRVTQFYTTTPQLPRGEKGLLCYGVENARSVWLSPPRHEVSAALTRCVEVEPSETTTYTLTAEDATGKQATQDLTVTLGAPRVKIIEVQVSSVDIKAGDPISICYKVSNAKGVKVSPLLSPSPGTPNCVVDKPNRTTTYTIAATGAAGDRDEEHVTVKVR